MKIKAFLHRDYTYEELATLALSIDAARAAIVRRIAGEVKP